MSQYTFDAIKDLWISAGGNPQFADAAARQAFIKSAGNSSVPGGLWGDNATAFTSDLDSARNAIAASNNGRSFATGDDPRIGAATGAASGSGRDAGPIFDLFGVGVLSDVVKYGAIMVAGWVLMIVGVTLMFFGSRPIKQLIGAAFGSAVGGVGFGLGANVTTGGQTGLPGSSGPSGASSNGPQPPPTGSPVPGPTLRPLPTGGNTRFFGASEVRRRRGVQGLAVTQEMPKVSEGAAAMHGPRKRTASSVSERGGGLFGAPSEVRETGRHRAE